MEHIEDITKRQFDFQIEPMHEPLKIELEIKSYTHNGTLAILLMRTEPFPEEREEMERMKSTEKFREFLDTATVNLEASERMPLNVQFVDENNLPGIGDWLEKNGIAKPTGMMTRSGWCLYPAYEFNVSQEQLKEVLERRMEINPEQTNRVLEKEKINMIYDLKSELDRCMTLGELKQTWLDLPKDIRTEVAFPDRVEADGHIHTLKQWEMKYRFSEPIPNQVKIYTLQEVKQIFEKAKAEILKGDYPTTKHYQKDGEYIIKGNVQVTEIHPHGGIFEYTNVYVAEKWDKEGNLLREFLAHDNSASDIMGHGPSLEYLPDGCTVFAEYMSSNTCDLELRDEQYRFSPKGSMIEIDSGDQYLWDESFNIRQTKQYDEAVDHCRSELHEGLDKVISKMESRIESQNSSKAIRK